jgi:hypothetical protein
VRSAPARTASSSPCCRYRPTILCQSSTPTGSNSFAGWARCRPIAAVISADSRVAYVSMPGGPKPKPGQRRGECRDPQSEAVRIDARDREPGRGAGRSHERPVIDIPSEDTHRARVGRPNAKLYVAAGNSDSSPSSTRVATRRGQHRDPPFVSEDRPRPTALALSPDLDALRHTGAERWPSTTCARAGLKGLVPTSVPSRST